MDGNSDDELLAELRSPSDEEPSNAEPWTPARLRELGVDYRIVNILGHGEIRGAIDVKQLALLVRNADYRPRGFGALVLRFQSPRASLLAYKSGKFIVVGARSFIDLHAAKEKYSSILQKVGFPHELGRFVVANVICAVNVRFRIRVEGLAHDHRQFCTYEPELFPGLIYRHLDPKVTILVFVSGKLMLTGGKTEADVLEVVGKMFPVLLQYRILEDVSSDESLDADDEAENEEQEPEESILSDVEDHGGVAVAGQSPVDLDAELAAIDADDELETEDEEDVGAFI